MNALLTHKYTHTKNPHIKRDTFQKKTQAVRVQLRAHLLHTHRFDSEEQDNSLTKYVLDDILFSFSSFQTLI